MPLLAEKLIGPQAGPLAGLMWLANPFVLGFGHLDAMDIPAALTTVVAALAMLHALRSPRRRSLALVGRTGGLAVMTRSTGLLVVFSQVMAVGFSARHLGACALTRSVARVIATAWATLGISYFLCSPGAMPRSPGALMATISRLILPPDWLDGLSQLLGSGTTPVPPSSWGTTRRAEGSHPLGCGVELVAHRLLPQAPGVAPGLLPGPGP